ncbi:ZIP zinc/iron transport family [Meredithblackwellia eburnea MCA 4105]
MSDTASDPCGPTSIDRIGLRVGALFIILVTSACATLFPVMSKRISVLRRNVPGVVFEFAKFFGSGVILATGFIHLLQPATEELGTTISDGGCISDAWEEYPYAFGICLSSLFATFVIQLVCFRVGTERLAKLGVDGPHPHITGTAHPHVPAGVDPTSAEESSESTPREKEEHGSIGEESDVVFFSDASEKNPASAQLMSVAILEFGVIFHSVIIGLTLAVTDPSEFNILFIVIIFHQMFEGLGLGTRLAFLKLPSSLNWVPFAGAIAYSLVTPIGIAIGLGARETLSISSANASIASGVLDATSSGILIYTATVELIAHEFIFNKAYHQCSWGKLWFSVVCFGLGAGIMALLGKWA